MAILLYIFYFIGLYQSNPQFFFAIITASSFIQVLISVCRFINLILLFLYSSLLNDKKNILDICLINRYIIFSIFLCPVATPIGIFW